MCGLVFLHLFETGHFRDVTLVKEDLEILWSKMTPKFLTVSLEARAMSSSVDI